MARGSKSEKKEVKKELNYKEFDITGEHNNDFKGRVYVDGKEAKSGKGTSYGITITINGVGIKGAKLWVPDDEEKDVCFLWPSYKDKDDKNQSFIAFYDKDDISDVKEAAAKIYTILTE